MYAQKLPSGKWRVWVKHAGQTRTVTAPTRTEAMLDAAEVRLAMAASGPREGASVTVMELLSYHLASRAPELSPTTVAEYVRVAQAIEGTDFADRPIRGLRAPDLSAFYDHLLHDGWAVGSVRRLHDLINVAWRHTAIYKGWAVINPATSSRPPKRAPYTIVPPDTETLRELFAAADDQFRLYLRLSANTGARRGELVALRWDDIDLDTGELAILRSVVYTPDSGITERPTKTGKRGQRRIAVAAAILPLLEKHRVGQRERLHGEPLYIFSDTAGIDHWHPQTPTQMFTKLRTRTGITGVRLHDLRHYTATQMLAAGQTAVQVAGRLGHADPHTTLSLYAHWIPITDRAAADDLDRGLE